MLQESTPIRHTSLASSAADWITTRIIEGQIKPGERITEVGLAAQMGISRSPVREALRSLSREGLITVEPRRGARVGELDRDHAADLYAARLLLEPECVRGAVAVITEARVAELGRILRTMTAAVQARDAAAYLSALKSYNWTLLDGCPNRVLFGFAEASWRSSLRYWDLLVRGSPSYLTQSLRRNRAVYAAIGRRDADKAAEVSRVVLERGGTELLKVLDKMGPRAEPTARTW